MSESPTEAAESRPGEPRPTSSSVGILAPAVLAVVALVVSEGCGGQETEKRIDLGVEAGSAAETEEVEAVAEAAPGDAQGEAEGVPEQLGPTEDAAAEAEPEP